MSFYESLFCGGTQIAVLIDPEKENRQNRKKLCLLVSNGYADVVLLGGSTYEMDNIDSTIRDIKQYTECPLILFPGNQRQLSPDADAVFLPSLLSSDSTEYLIKKHVEAAYHIKNLGIPILPIGYILVGSDSVSAASHVTNTQPIAYDDADLIVRTALAGQLLGMKAIYLEAGSGAAMTIPVEIITAVKDQINIPLIVGGGLDSIEKLEKVLSTDPSMIVIGNILETNPDLLISIRELQKSYLKGHEERRYHKIHR